MLSLFIPVGVIIAASLLTLSSVAMHLFWLQLLWIALGASIVIFFYFLDWRIILNYRWFIGACYLIVILLFIFAYFKGPTIRNTKSWLTLGPITFEPVEAMKIILILLFANYFGRRHVSIGRWKNVFISFLYFIVPAVLVVLQPDLGSALVLFGIWFGFLLLSGLPQQKVLIAFLVFIFAGAVMWTSVLKNYQRERIVAVFYPTENALGVSYSATQSKIAIGSAGTFGKGFRQGTQLQLGFLTEPASDFAFSAFIEEWGLIGAIVVICSFLAFIYGILKIGADAHRNFEKFVCLGVAMMLGIQFILNSGSELGLLPVIGVTFPFLSYGGSSMAVNFFMLAIVNAIGRKKV